MRGFGIILGLLMTLTVRAQLNDISEVWKGLNHSGDNHFKAGLYEAAIESYKLELEDGKYNDDVVVRLAQCYRKLGNYREAQHYFDILGKPHELDSAYYEDYADVQLAMGDKEDALVYYQAVLREQPENRAVKEKIKGINEWDSYFKYKEYVDFEPVSFNTEYADYGIRKFRSGWAYISSREIKSILDYNHLRTTNSLTSIYTTSNDPQEDKEHKVLKLDHYKRLFDGPVSEHLGLVAISRSNMEKNDGNRLGIYFYRIFEDMELRLDYGFAFNSSAYNVTHPAFNDGGDTLFFASDMPGGVGGLDLYCSVYTGNTWSEPINMGNIINTPGNETYPFSDNGEFYFSSDGHAGIGGMDTYRISHQQGKLLVINLGSPINSGWDDFALYIKGNKGYISSNRPGGEGLDDIYSFYLHAIPIVPDSINLDLAVLDDKTKTMIEGAKVLIIAANDTTELFSNSYGNVNGKVLPGRYEVIVKSEAYHDQSFNLTVDEKSDIEEIVRMKPEFSVQITSPDSIMFAFGEYNLLNEEANEELDSIAATLRKYPQYDLKISAHTDSQGDAYYNKWLSEKRAETAANYLINLGIDLNRIHAFGYGETQLLNNCRDGIKCSDKLHAVNRRLEFDFIRNDIPDK